MLKRIDVRSEFREEESGAERSAALRLLTGAKYSGPALAAGKPPGWAVYFFVLARTHSVRNSGRAITSTSTPAGNPTYRYVSV
jgi:hypothetical protein